MLLQDRTHHGLAATIQYRPNLEIQDWASHRGQYPAIQELGATGQGRPGMWWNNKLDTLEDRSGTLNCKTMHDRVSSWKTFLVRSIPPVKNRAD